MKINHFAELNRTNCFESTDFRNVSNKLSNAVIRKRGLISVVSCVLGKIVGKIPNDVQTLYYFGTQQDVQTALLH